MEIKVQRIVRKVYGRVRINANNCEYVWTSLEFRRRKRKNSKIIEWFKLRES